MEIASLTIVLKFMPWHHHYENTKPLHIVPRLLKIQFGFFKMCIFNQRGNLSVI